MLHSWASRTITHFCSARRVTILRLYICNLQQFLTPSLFCSMIFHPFNHFGFTTANNEFIGGCWLTIIKPTLKAQAFSLSFYMCFCACFSASSCGISYIQYILIMVIRGYFNIYDNATDFCFLSSSQTFYWSNGYLNNCLVDPYFSLSRGISNCYASFTVCVEFGEPTVSMQKVIYQGKMVLLSSLSGYSPGHQQEDTNPGSLILVGAKRHHRTGLIFRQLLSYLGVFILLHSNLYKTNKQGPQ